MPGLRMAQVIRAAGWKRGNVMARRWGDLSERSRRLIIAAAVGEALLKAAALIDIRRRPASQIRGSKRIWIVAAVLVNSGGVGPLSYFAFGRRQHAEREV
jgi:hypothetical protein